ncbi:MAG TPA: aldehyde dehydrogenase family protein, partial [Bacillales bacterium]
MVETKVETHGLFIDGKWVETDESTNVLNKYSQEAFAKVSVASHNHVSQSVAAARRALDNEFSPYQRYEVLMKVASLLKEERELFARTLTKEVGKTLGECYGEVDRSIQTLLLSAEEAKRIHGDGVPVEAAPGSENRMAFTIRVPVGVVAAIAPFNVPLNLVCHKVGPALAAGNSVVLKPAGKTPVVSVLLTKLFEKAGLPNGRLNLVTGSGGRIGDWLLENKDVDMFTFTGSKEVGEYIRSKAGVREVALELGNNSATIVHCDADLEKAASQITARGFNNAGQVCISVQRVYVHEKIFDEFLSVLKGKVEALKLGDPFDESTDVGPMIDVKEAERVEQWVQEAVEEGAEIVAGGK